MSRTMPVVAWRGAAFVVAAGAVLALAAWVTLGVASVRTPVAYIVPLGVIVAVVLRMGRVLFRDLESGVRHKHGAIARSVPRPPLLAPLERRLAGATRQRRLYVNGLRPILWDLASERVRHSRGVDLAGLVADDPDRARTILGEALAATGTGKRGTAALTTEGMLAWLTTTEQEGTPPTPAQVQALVTAVGRL